MNLHSGARGWIWAAVLLACFFFIEPLFAQEGTILGTVTDATGAVVPNAKVEVKNVSTGIIRTLTTNDNGIYHAPGLAPSTYEVRVTAKGFNTAVNSGVVLQVETELTVNVQLKIGDVSQTVEVTGTGAAVELASSMVSDTVTENTIREMPLNGRDWTQLATLEPGVNRNWSQDDTAVNRNQRGNGIMMDISGGRASENNYRLNGISINDYANTAPGSSLGQSLGVDAVQEFSLLTGIFSAEYGKSSGGVISAVTKSGSNALHGSGFDFLRNSVLNSRSFFDGAKVPSFRRNQFGGSLGGPIKKDKTFWFFDYEGFRQSQGITQTNPVLSANARAGNLSTGKVTVSPFIAPYLAIFPLPNAALIGAGDTGYYSYAAQLVSNEDFLIGKMDHRFSDKDSLSGSYMWDNSAYSQPDQYNDALNQGPSRRQLGTLEETHMFSPTLLNTARIGVSRVVTSAGYIDTVFNPFLADPKYGFVPGLPVGWVTVTGLGAFNGGLGPESGTFFAYTSIQAYDDLYWTRGKHSMKFGFGFERQRDDSDEANLTNGQVIFNSLSLFLTDAPATFSAQFPGTDAIREERQSVFAGYFQDDYKVRPNLTVNLGIRYEMATNLTDAQGKLATLLHVTDATPTVVGGLFQQNPTTKDFEPRVGFAWDPFGTGKTSIRGGVAMYDILPLAYQNVNQIPRTPPFYDAGTTNSVPAGLSPQSWFGLLGPGTLRTVYIEPYPHRSYSLQWTLNVQRELGKGFALRVGYLGSHGVHLPYRQQSMNTVPFTNTPAGVVFPSPTTTKVFNPRYGPIRAELYDGVSSYHGLQTALVKKFAHGFNMQIAYTWSKSIDDSSDTFSDNESLNSVNNPIPYWTAFSRGPSNFNIGQNFVLNAQYVIPVPTSWSGVAKTVLGGWQLGGIATLQSGTPFTPMISGDPAGTQLGGDSDQRPNVVAGCNAINSGQLQYVNLSCLTPPAIGVIYHDIGRNRLVGPPMKNLDFSLFKNFAVPKISEKFNVQFRMEAFNATNHVNFYAPGSASNDTFFSFSKNAFTPVAGAGLLNNAWPGREIQFGLKFTF